MLVIKLDKGMEAERNTPAIVRCERFLQFIKQKMSVGEKHHIDSVQLRTQLANLLPGVSYRMELNPEFRLTHIGEGMPDLLGYSAKELLNRNTLTYLQLQNPEHETILSLKRMHCTKSREVKTLQYNMFTKSRQVKLIEDCFIGEYDNKGHLVAINGYLKEFKRASVKLKLQNQLEAYRAAIDVNIISSITDAHGIIIHVNDNFKRISQYTDDELLGKTHSIVRSNHHPKSFFEQMWKTITAGKMWHGDILNRAKDGSLYWVATVIIPVFSDQNKISSFLSLRMLITEQKRSEEQREKYVRVLEDIAHVVAHDVRGPVCSILGLLNVVEKDACDHQDLKPVREYLIHAAKKLDEMTRELSAKIYSADQELKSGTLTKEKQLENNELEN